MTTVTVRGIEFEGPAQRQPASTIKVGDPVKLLKKQYNDTYETHAGVVVAIDLYQALPTVVVMYAQYSYGSAPELKFEHLNEKSKDVELLRMCDEERVAGVKEDALEKFEREETELLRKLETLRERREFFTRRFAVAFSTVARDLKTGAPAELAVSA